VYSTYVDEDERTAGGSTSLVRGELSLAVSDEIYSNDLLREIYLEISE
jgi:hypothetical protein